MAGGDARPGGPARRYPRISRSRECLYQGPPRRPDCDAARHPVPGNERPHQGRRFHGAGDRRPLCLLLALPRGRRVSDHRPPRCGRRLQSGCAGNGPARRRQDGRGHRLFLLRRHRHIAGPQGHCLRHRYAGQRVLHGHGEGHRDGRGRRRAHHRLLRLVRVERGRQVDLLGPPGRQCPPRCCVRAQSRNRRGHADL